MDDPLFFLQQTLCKLSQGIALKSLQKAYTQISTSYQSSNFSLDFSPLLCLSYALARMPATLSVQKQVWQEFQKQAPVENESFSITDIGSGPGTSFWTLLRKKWVKQLILIEKQKNFIDLSKKILQESPPIEPYASKIKYINSNLSKSIIPKADIIFSSYYLNETSNLQHNIENIWQACQKYIVLIEPGTPANFERLLFIRNFLINKGAVILAPCPGNIPCPLANKSKTWCHFRVKLPRYRNHIYIKSAKHAFEEEPYFYLIAKKSSAFAPSLLEKNRILSSIRKTKIGAETLLCTPNGIEKITVSKKEKLYKTLIKKKWGETL